LHDVRAFLPVEKAACLGGFFVFFASWHFEELKQTVRRKGKIHRKPAKAHLPEKICPVCVRPFSWRRKWAKDWDQVRYCSEACKRAKREV